jgi:hypothetical protein
MPKKQAFGMTLRKNGIRLTVNRLVFFDCPQFPPKYVFWRNPIRLKGYRSNHIRNIKRKRARKTANAVPGPETGTEALKIKI